MHLIEKIYYKLLIKNQKKRQIKEKEIILSTIPLSTFSITTKEITGYAGGFLVEYLNKHIIITVQHAVDTPKLIAINLEAYQGRPNMLFFKPYPISIMKLKQNVESIDKTKKYTNLNELFEETEDDYDMVYSDIPLNIIPKCNDINSPLFNYARHIIPLSFPINVSEMETFKFYGLHNLCNNNGLQNFEEIYCNDLKLVGKDQHYYYFKTKKKFKYKIEGCSGSPIFDSKGTLVSMIVGQNGKYIQGLNLSMLEAIFYASYNEEIYEKN